MASPSLYIIDFDFTVTTIHMHHRLCQAIGMRLVDAQDFEALWELVKDIPPTGSAELWRTLISTIEKNGHLVAIASFSEFPTLIIRYFQEVIGIKNIMVESWLPRPGQISNKNEHIRFIKRRLNFQGENECITLIDDDENNLHAAAQMHYHTINVLPGDPSGRHIQMILEKIPTL
ncbi:MAG: hypothetical protein H0W64_12020 [Gammaproteobacteria bacterium]|nr:hypothetical protein [Gammaproteobacteria bacterium]